MEMFQTVILPIVFVSGVRRVRGLLGGGWGWVLGGVLGVALLFKYGQEQKRCPGNGGNVSGPFF